MPVVTALVIATGADVDAVRAADGTDLVICADGGLDVAISAGLPVDLVVGDLDSVTPGALADARESGVEIDWHRVDKDESDLELALAAALDRGSDRIVVHLRVGGRLDHQLANLLVLASPRWAGAEVSAVIGPDRVWVLRHERRLPLTVGAPLALHAIGGPAEGVRTSGLRYEMTDERLDAMSARGIANEVVDSEPMITAASGVLLVISSPTR